MTGIVRRQGGFTLLELIVSLALLSMLVVATLAAMRTLGDTQSRLGAAAERVDEMRLVSAFLRGSLEQSNSLMRMDGGQPLDTYFFGGPREMIWVAPARGVAPGLHVHRLYINDEGSLMVQLDAYRQRHLEPEWESLPSYPLLEQVDEFILEFRRFPDSPWEQGEWLQEWDYGPEFPSHVRLNLQVAGRDWPELVVFLATGGLPFRLRVQ